jgi:hypothetical protein
MTTEAFCRAFRYRAGSIIALWKDVSRDDEPSGVCQDFALSVLSIETGGKPWRHILTGRAMIWRAKSPVNKTLPRHAILWMKGKGFIDSTDRFWRDTPAPNRLRWPAGLPVILGLVLTARMWGVL